jgi:hypothetical protein
MRNAMTEHETTIIETYRRVINTLRHRHLSNCDVQRLPRSLLDDVLWLESELRHARGDSGEFRRTRAQIEEFLLSSYGVILRREAHRSAQQHPRPHPQGLSNTKSPDSTPYGKRGFLAKFNAKPINKDTKRALGFLRKNRS